MTDGMRKKLHHGQVVRAFDLVYAGDAHRGCPVGHDAAQGHGRGHGIGIGVDDNEPAEVAADGLEKTGAAWVGLRAVVTMAIS
jgi:hypothetical protein